MRYPSAASIIREDVQPNEHCGVESRVPWFTVQDDLPHIRTEDIPDFVPPKKLYMHLGEE